MPPEFYDPKDRNDFLSNFYATDILFDSIIWPSAEHLYQSFKFTDVKIRNDILSLSCPKEAFRLSQKCTKYIREDWSVKKTQYMYFACLSKFFQNNALRDKLLLTNGPCRAMYDDYFWGVGKELTGKNIQGRILMRIRHELKQTITQYNDISCCFLPISDRIFLLVVFATEGKEHFVLYTGPAQTNRLLVRIHSECATGDLLGSQKCDCGEQFDSALNDIISSEHAVLAYLRQEGRGIGLIDKAKAYELQWYGQDTIEANVNIGREIDSRSYSVLSPLIKLLRPSLIDLITNNPQKISFFDEFTFVKVHRLSTKPTKNPFNRKYLDTKKNNMNHLIG